MPARNCLAHPPTEWTDAELLDRVLRGEDRAWSELSRRFRPLLYGCIGQIARTAGLSRTDVEEIYANVLWQLVRRNMDKLRKYDPTRGAKLGTWLGMIAVHATYDYLRLRAREPSWLDLTRAHEVEGSEPSALGTLLDLEAEDEGRRIVAELSERDQTFVKLYFGEHAEPADIARRMKINVKTVYSKKHKIRAHVRARLSPSSDAPNPALAA
ncbi:MAG TPA: sigma-70 family RNA polymerase sigma factor [Kofleriaceae bacterium]|nr:sigma-70 family RNA polymerase sigma factor [Kofleriaceae bacterium]